MADVLKHADGSHVSSGAGHYVETYEKTGTEWKIKTSVWSKFVINGELDIHNE